MSDATLPPADDPLATTPPTPVVEGAASPTVPGYEILGELGRGGMGVVYKARQIGLNRIVALKMILSGAHAGESELARFRTEAEAIARLQHPGIVQVFEISEHNGLPFLSLEFVEGGSLAAKLDGTPLPGRDAAKLVEALARAVAAAHEKGVVHRDLKPANVLLSNLAASAPGAERNEREHLFPGADATGLPKITDFGLARKLDEASQTRTGNIMGTPSYMAPEQADGRKDVGPACDIYALGAILYELLTGRPPFKAATALDTILQVVSEEPVEPRLLQPKLHRDLNTITLKCLQKDPAKRYASASDLGDDLGHYLADEPIRARPTGYGELAARWLRKHLRAVAFASLSVVGTALAIVAQGRLADHLAESRRGKLDLTTDGPTLTAEIHSVRIDESEPVRARHTVPMAEPVALPEGSYKVHISRPGTLSETWMLEVERGQNHRYDVRLNERELWPPLAGLPPGTRVEPVAAGGRSDLVLVEPGRVAYLEGATRRQRWEATFSHGNAPAGRYAAAWSALLGQSSSPNPRHLGVLSSGPDLDGDGVADVVLAGRSAASLVALAGKSGKLLWWYHAQADGPPGVDPKRAQVLNHSHDNGVVGEPLLLRQAKRKPAFVAAFVGGGDTMQHGDKVLQSPNGQAWVDRAEYGEADPTWRYRLPPPPGGRLTAARITGPQLTRVGKREAALIVADDRAFALDLKTGQPAWEPLDLGLRPFRPALLAELDGEAVAVWHGLKDNGEWLVAVALTRRRVLWRAELKVEASYFDHAKPQHVPVLLGNSHVAARSVQGDFSTRGKSFVNLFRLADGAARWSSRLAEQSLSTLFRDSEHLQFLAGPDLDGDGEPDLLAAWAAYNEHGPRSGWSLFVYAFSAASGRPLWWWREALVDAPGRFDQFFLWQPGANGQPQVVLSIQDAMSGQKGYVLNAANGTLAHTLTDCPDLRAADLDGDGLPDLYFPRRDSRGRHLEEGFEGEGELVSTGDPIELRAIRGHPFEPWRRLGAWGVVQDLDGDGVPDVARPGARVLVASGRTGRMLWREGNPVTTSPSRPPAGGPVRVVANRLFSPPLPWGDFDGDGYPDLLAVTPGLNRKQDEARLSWDVVSGKTGRVTARSVVTAWPEGCRNMRLGSRLAFLPGQSPGGGLLLAARRFDDSSTAPRGVAVTLDAFGGKLLCEFDLDHISSGPHFDPSRLPFVALDLGRGHPDLVALAATETRAAETRAYDGPSGDLLWRTRLRASCEYAWREWAAPVACDFGGKHAVVLLDRGRVVALDAATGNELWSLPVEGLEPIHPFPMNLAAASGGRVCALLPRSGGVNIGVLHPATNRAAWRAVQIDDMRRPDQAKLHVHDLDGDGQDELLFADAGKVWAAGDDPARPVWGWPTSPADEVGDWAVLEVLPGKPATVVVQSRQRREVRGLNGKTGQPAWLTYLVASPGEVGRSAVVWDGQPILITARAGRDTVCRTWVTPRPAPTADPLAEPGDDPRRSRPLPWATEAVSYRYFVFVFPALTLALFVVPRLLFRRSRWAFLVWMALLVVAYWPVQAFNLLDSRGAPWFVTVLYAFWGATLGVATMLPAAALARWSWQRRWGRSAALVAIFITATLAVAGVWLWGDTGREPCSVYSWDRWYVVLLPGYVVTGLALMAGRPGAALVRKLRSRRRRTSPTGEGTPPGPPPPRTGPTSG